jgi:hypothetical protein
MADTWVEDTDNRDDIEHLQCRPPGATLCKPGYYRPDSE